MKMQKKLMFMMVVPIVTFFFILSILDLKYQEEEKYKALNKEINRTNRILTLINLDPFWNVNLETLETIAKEISEKTEIVKYELITEKEEKIISITKNLKPNIEYRLEIIKGNTKIGTLIVGYTYKYIYEYIKKLKLRILFYGLIMTVFLIIIIYYISKWFSIPINKISSGLIEIDEGNYEIKLDLQKSSEFQSIEKYFNKMADTLDKINMENIHSKKVLENKNLEIEAAYNQMMAINETLIATYKELEESEDKYRKIFDYAPAGMMIFDIKNKKIVESNKEFLNIIEIKKENIEEIQIKEIFQQVDLEEIKNKIKEEKIIYNMELDLKKPLKSIIFSAIPQSLNKFKVLIAIKDITELKEMQKKLKEYAKNLEKKVEDRTKKLQEANEKIKLQQGDLVKSAYNKGLIEVTSGMMHNIGNVVNILHLNLEEIYNEIPKEESKIVKFFRNIVYNKIKGFPNKDVELEKIIDVMPQIINLLSDFEKKLKNNLRFILKKSTHVKEIIQLQQNFVGELGTEDYNEIDEIINEVVEIYGLYQGKKNIKLELNLNAKKKILCDKSQIVQVIGNLVKNSYEAIEEKKEKNGLVKISTKLYKNNEIEINLEDNGIGVEPEKLKEIFEFGYSTKKGNLKGCGFGLHSSNGIIKKYGGRLEVFSEKNKGTKFKITLPLKRKEKQKSEEKNNFSDINNK